MGRHVAGDAPEMDRLVAESIARIGAEIEALHVPKLQGVVLGGGYGRGEGGVIEECKIENVECKIGGSRSSNAECRLSNDLDFFAITEEGASAAETAAIAAALEPISKEWTARIGIDVDFIVRTPWRIRHDQDRVMVQELLHGHVDVAGAQGETLFRDVARRPPEEFPWMEAARLMMNRGVGLLLALERGEGEFAVRNVNKCILGAGDARLIVRHAYRWRATDRAAALGDALYSAAVEWKFRPRATGVCDWEKARETWLDAWTEIAAAEPPERNLYNTLRWLVRRRTLGDWRTLGLNPVVRVLRQVAQRIAERQTLSAALRKDWNIFN